MSVILGVHDTLFTIPITASETFTPPFNGTAVIHCIGAGGSGACGDYNNGTGGGAGGYCRKLVTLSTGTNLTLVVGAGAVPTRNAGSGSAGGNTTATDGSFTLTANGGGAGVSSATTGSAGGTASGGDVNNTGGASGSAGGGMSGGGAVGVLGTGDAGDAGTAGDTNANNIYYGGHSDVQSPQFENTNGLLRGGGKGGRFFYRFDGGSSIEINGGFLAGGGSGYTETTGDNAFGGDGGIGGGGGSANHNNQTEGMVNSGAGGNGLILIMYTAIT